MTSQKVPCGLDPVQVAVAVDPRQHVGVLLQQRDQLRPAVPVLAGAGRVGAQVGHGAAGVVAEDQDVLVLMGGQGAVQPVQLRGADRAEEGAAAVGGVQADAEHAVRDREGVVEVVGVHARGRVAVADRAGAGAARVEVGVEVLLRGEGPAPLVRGDRPRAARVALQHLADEGAVRVALRLHRPVDLHRVGVRDLLHLAAAGGDVGRERAAAPRAGGPDRSGRRRR